MCVSFGQGHTKNVHIQSAFYYVNHADFRYYGVGSYHDFTMAVRKIYKVIVSS